MEKETVVVGVAWWMWYEEVHLLNHRIIEKCFLIRLQGVHVVQYRYTPGNPVSYLRNVTKNKQNLKDDSFFCDDK